MKIFSVKNIAYMASTVLFLTHSANASMGHDGNNDEPQTPKRGIVRDYDASENEENINFTPNVNRVMITPSAPKKPHLTRAGRRAVIRQRNEDEINDVVGLIVQQILAGARPQEAEEENTEN